MSNIHELQVLLAELTQGTTNVLPAESFVPVVARRVRAARVVWVNWPLLREWGWEGKPSLQAEQLLLDTFAYRIPSDDDPPAWFAGPAKTFLADRYGGDGVSPNTGSGRAAAIGTMQIKGIGTTPLADPSTPFEHRHGSLYLGDAIREATWGELNQHETPYGANRVLLIIDLGSFFSLPDGRKRARGLLVRQLPLRPAHFLLNTHRPMAASELRELELKLVRRLAPRGALASAESVRKGLFQLTERLARQHATLVAHRTPHGAMSSSNLQLDGALLDMETQSSQAGHGPTLAIAGSIYRSDCTKSLEDTLRALVFTARLGLPPRLAAGLPAHDELAAHLHGAHHETLLTRLIALCGFPELAFPDGAPSSSYLALATCIRTAITETKEPVLIDRGVRRWTGRYDIGRLLFGLACLHRQGPQSAKRVLLRGRARTELEPLCDAYFDLRQEAQQHAATLGIPAATLDDLILRLCSVRNAERPDLYLTRFQKQTALLLRDQSRVDEPDLVQRYIDQLIDQNRRFFCDTRELCVIREWCDRRSSARVRYAYAPRLGYVLDVRIPRRDGLMSFFGYEQPSAARAPVQISLRMKTKGGARSTQTFPLRDSGSELRVVTRLSPDVLGFGLGLSSDAHVSFAPLPSLFFQGVRAIQQDAALRRTVRAA